MNYKISVIMLLICVPFWGLSAQEIPITGTVTVASDGMPLPGVTVMIKGTNQGTSTDMDGNYSITTNQGDVLSFSSIGFAVQEVPVNGQTTINIALVESMQGLDEVVVTALGISRDKKSLGYATQEVDGENFNLTNEQNVLGSLSGRVAGVQVTGASGASMGGTQKIKIRGVNSIGAGDQPLIVIDGTPISNANFSGSDQADYGNLAQDVNPNDIESVNVLKGPAASALYGIRGQYGVIMITTKKGKKGPKKVSVDFSSTFSVESAYNFIELQNMYGGGSSQTFRTLPNGQPYVDMSVDESWGPKLDGTPVRQVFSFYPQDPEYGQLTPFVAHPNNVKNYYNTGTTFNNNVSISGGNENTSVRLSFNNTQIEGIVPNTNLDRTNVGLSVSLDLNDKVTVSSNINYAGNKGRRPSQGSEYGANYMVQWFQRNVDMNRLRNYKYDDGTFLHWNLSRPDSNTGEITDFEPLYWNNPYFEAYENTSDDYRDRFFGDIGVSYKIIPELEISGFVRSDMFTQNIQSRQAFGGTRVPSFSIGKYQNKEFNYELLAQYKKSWEKLSLDATVGGNIYDREYTYLSQATVGGLSSPGFYNIDASIDRPEVDSYLLEKQIRSFYSLVSLGYDGTFFIDASLRNDNSSTLPDDNNSYWYPSFSGSIVFSELLEWEPLSFGKVRASYAKAGSDLDPYLTTPFYEVGTVYNGTSTLYVPDKLNNPNIKPSFSNSFEAGLELNFFNNRLGFDFTYYQQKNKDQILDLDISGTSGYDSTIINAGLIENDGFELSVNAAPVKINNFSWDFTFNINKNNSEVVELAPGIDVYTYGSTTYSSVTSYLNSYEGEPFGSLVGQAYQRDEASGKILLDDENMPLYTDATHNFGTVLPDFNGGFQNNIRIGQFNIAAMIDFQGGGQFFSRSKMLSVRTGQDILTVATNDNGMNVRDPLEDGGGVKVTGISASTGEDVTAYVDARSYYRNVIGRRIYEEWLYDASYVKLREVRVQYNLGEKIMEKLPFSTMSLALIARNPAMIWQKAPKGINPSEISTGAQAISWYESGQLPSVRSFGVNLNVTF
ncbi:SusC/RagA family TonB-linked outer membrane protein [Galbibacter pacificus]|uniref:SusC/RagA family TonB-linked outer membrane protein n=1 Tax=Galbibacter pacificus TaxID=2996052 RepID=A0ABT6FRL4_9FLAO|nr:SusC/RagA family TonB-linked outer membrane protein [Galbibacter pacificus]MDG3582964.1 SusC/RagA family TonB-linked outer membrane protein [Galbibacter pacificus]MDG3585917.1 SusC/RagA family TonB-linked outer membrane protein [Galbibacter pacificus]